MRETENGTCNRLILPFCLSVCRCVRLCACFCLTGVRAQHSDWHTSHAAGGIRDRACVHVRNAQAATDDNLRERQVAHTDMSELS